MTHFSFSRERAAIPFRERVIDLKIGLSCGAGPVTDSAHDWIRRALLGDEIRRRRTNIHFGKVSWVVVHRMYGAIIREFLVIWDKLIEMRSGRRRGPCAKSRRESADRELQRCVCLGLDPIHKLEQKDTKTIVPPEGTLQLNRPQSIAYD